MRRIKAAAAMLKINRRTFLGVVLLYMAVSSAIVTPLFRRASYLVMQTVGFRYLTAENIGRFVRNPLVFAALLVLGLLYAAFEFLEIGALIYVIDRSRLGRKVCFLDALLFAGINLKGLLRRHYFGLLWIVLLLTPVYHLGTTINLLNRYAVLSALFKSLRRRRLLIPVLLFLALLCLGVFLHWLYVGHFYTLENFSARQSGRRSSDLLRSRRRGRRVSVIVMHLLLFLLYTACSFCLLVLISLMKRMSILSAADVSSIQVASLQIISRLYDAVLTPVTLLTISGVYYEAAEETGRPVIYARRAADLKGLFGKNSRLAVYLSDARRMRHVELVLFVISLGGFLLYNFSSARDQFQLRIEHLRTVEVSAHRGASMYYPENTMAAFVGAVEQGADWVELDVQETADGQVIVMHDESLKRTCGVDKKAWELTYAEIAQLDAGSFFNSDFAGERIPLLSEVVAYALETGLRLNIELKPNTEEKDLVDLVLDIIEAYDFTDQCVITSQKYEVLRQVKKRNETIYTVYVMGLAYGAINRLNAADAFSIRATSLSQSLVTDLHNRGLEVYAWTVDSRSNINRMINLGVDNIITNNVPLAIECINTSRTDSLLLEWIRMRLDSLLG